MCTYGRSTFQGVNIILGPHAGRVLVELLRLMQKGRRERERERDRETVLVVPPGGILYNTAPHSWGGTTCDSPSPTSARPTAAVRARTPLPAPHLPCPCHSSQDFTTASSSRRNRSTRRGKRAPDPRRGHPEPNPDAVGRTHAAASAAPDQPPSQIVQDFDVHVTLVEDTQAHRDVPNVGPRGVALKLPPPRHAVPSPEIRQCQPSMAPPIAAERPRKRGPS